MNEHDIELSAWFDGELSGEARRRVEYRLANDPDYAEALHELERMRTMIATCVDAPPLHGRLMCSIREETAARARGQRRVGMALAVAAAALLAVTAWVALVPPATPPAQQAAPAAAPDEQAEEPPLQIAETTPPETDSTAPPPPAAAALPLELVGTVTGANPQALIVTVTPEGRSTKTYGLGDEVLPGVTLTGVESRQVTLDDHGRPVTLAIGRRVDVEESDRLSGVWVVRSGTLPGTFEPGKQFVIRGNGPGAAVVIDPNSTRQAPIAYRRTEHRVEIEGQYDDEYFFIRGQFSDDWNTLQLNLEEPAELPAGVRFVLERVDIDLDTELARSEAVNTLRTRLSVMYRVLRKHAEQQDGRFPDVPEDLRDYEQYRALFEEAEGEESTYHPGRRLPGAGVFDTITEPSYEPVETYPDRLMAHEQRLRAIGFAAVMTGEPLIEIRIPEFTLTGTLDTRGSVQVETGEDPAGQLGDLAALRASCQNNLKQLGLVIKMYENEHHGYSPAGWLSVYPEYLTDTSIITSPKDPPGTDSYIYLLPATHLESYAAGFISDPTNPGARAMIQSRIPMVLNRTDFPGSAPGRNVLFMDGHVEYVRTDSPQWRERIMPYLR